MQTTGLIFRFGFNHPFFVSKSLTILSNPIDKKSFSRCFSEGNARQVEELGGFCEDYAKLHDELQLHVDKQHRAIQIVNTEFYADLPVFGPSETKARILSLPEAYDRYEVLLVGWENADSETPYRKRVVKAVRLDNPSDIQHAGLCLLGPVFHRPYGVAILFADTRRPYGGEWEPYVYDEFWTEKEREDFIKSYAGHIDETVGDRVVRLHHE